MTLACLNDTLTNRATWPGPSQVLCVLEPVGLCFCPNFKSDVISPTTAGFEQWILDEKT